MHEVIQDFLRGQYHYNFHATPVKIKSREEAQREGLNCGTLVHLLIREIFGIHLPIRLMCLEMFYDTQYLRTITDDETMTLGDIMFVGRLDITNHLQAFTPNYAPDGTFANWEEHPKLHLTLFTGIYEGGDPLFVHANQFDQGIALWPLSHFARYWSYETCYAIRRLREPLLAPR